MKSRFTVQTTAAPARPDGMGESRRQRFVAGL